MGEQSNEAYWQEMRKQAKEEMDTKSRDASDKELLAGGADLDMYKNKDRSSLITVNAEQLVAAKDKMDEDVAKKKGRPAFPERK